MKQRFERQILLPPLLLVAVVGCSSNAGSSAQSHPKAGAAPAPTIIAAPVPSVLPPVAAPTAAAAATPTSGAPSGITSLCDFPYFPVKAGAVWKYHWTAGTVSSDETFTIISVTADGFTRRATFSNIPGSVDEHWSCSSQGMTNPQSAMPTMTVNGHGSSTQVRVMGHSGISLPPANRWRVGTIWNESSQMLETIAAGSASGSTIQATLDETSKIVGEEQVQVPADTFTALRVDSTFVEHLGSMTISIPSSSWYAQGVGQIKVTANAGAGGAVTAELTSYTP